MNRPKWTPGPWRLQHHEQFAWIVAEHFIPLRNGGAVEVPAHSLIVAENDGDSVCVAASCDWPGNGHLIVAAPDLYDALDRIMSYAHTGAQVQDVDPNEQPQFVAAYAALKKARGE